MPSIFHLVPWFYKMDENGETPMSRARKSGIRPLHEMLKALESAYDEQHESASSARTIAPLELFDPQSSKSTGTPPPSMHPMSASGSVLMAAIASGSCEVVEELVRNGADVNAVNSLGMTCLHLAVMNGALEMVDLLIGLGAKVNVPLEGGGWLTPASLALVMGYDEVYLEISQRGGKVRFMA